MSGLSFNWDPHKDTSNKKKHGVSFSEAITVFEDNLARLIPDPDHSEGEARFILMGISKKQRLLLVSHCERPGKVVRIFSARRANRIERKQYEEFSYA